MTDVSAAPSDSGSQDVSTDADAARGGEAVAAPDDADTDGDSGADAGDGEPDTQRAAPVPELGYDPPMLLAGAAESPVASCTGLGCDSTGFGVVLRAVPAAAPALRGEVVHEGDPVPVGFSCTLDQSVGVACEADDFESLQLALGCVSAGEGLRTCTLSVRRINAPVSSLPLARLVLTQAGGDAPRSWTLLPRVADYPNGPDCPGVCTSGNGVVDLGCDESDDPGPYDTNPAGVAAGECAAGGCTHRLSVAAERLPAWSPISTAVARRGSVVLAACSLDGGCSTSPGVCAMLSCGDAASSAFSACVLDLRIAGDQPAQPVMVEFGPEFFVLADFTHTLGDTVGDATECAVGAWDFVPCGAASAGAK